MSAERALPDTVDWSVYQDVEGNSTAQSRHSFKDTELFRHHLGRFVGTGPKGRLVGPAHSVVLNDSVRFTLSPTAIFAIAGEAYPFELAEPWAGATLYSDLPGTMYPFASPTYELLKAITDAPEEQRLACMRVLGLIDADEDGYVPRGPDPQSVDFELMALLDPST